MTAIDAGALIESMADVVLLPDGTIMAGGHHVNSANYEDCVLVRYLPDGTSYSSF